MKFKKRIKRLENMLWDLRDQLSVAQAKLGRAYSKAEKAEMEEGRVRAQCREVEILLKMARAKETARKKLAKKSAKKRARKAEQSSHSPVAPGFSEPVISGPTITDADVTRPIAPQAEPRQPDVDGSVNVRSKGRTAGAAPH